MRICLVAILAFCLSWLPLSAAELLVVGDTVPKISAKDQHGKEFLFTNNLQVLLIVTEMSTAKTANVKLAEQAEGFLEKHSAAYLMDIHAMPGIARYFALPKMRKYPQRIILFESEEALMAFPAKSGCVTLLTLSSAGKIEKIEYWNPDQNPVSKYLP